jgi:hypothetical protein
MLVVDFLINTVSMADDSRRDFANAAYFSILQSELCDLDFLMGFWAGSSPDIELAASSSFVYSKNQLSECWCLAESDKRRSEPLVDRVESPYLKLLRRELLRAGEERLCLITSFLESHAI